MIRTPRFVVYTAVFGNYDEVPEINSKWDCDFIFFTDNPALFSNGWNMQVVKLDGESPAQANRRFKMLPHKYFPSHEQSLYVDGNIRMVADPTPLFHKYLDNGVIAIPKHQDRNCVYAEAWICIKEGLVDKNITEQQMLRYAENGFQKNYGLTENNIILRKHHDLNVVSLMESWWSEYCKGGRRDQLGLPYLTWEHKLDVLEIIEGPRISTKYFEVDLHATDKSKPFIKRLARKASGKKHLSNFYLIISRIVSLVVTIKNWQIDNRKS